jgi:tetratricopeptide (TPR) repeat protein
MTDEDLLAELLLRWEELHEKGQETSAEALCRDCPHLAPLLGERIRALKVTAWMERPDDGGGTQPAPATPSAPHTLSRRHRLDEKIAEGGFAEVWKGYNQELRRAVAVKLPRAGRLLSTERFMAEARRVAGLKQPGVVPVFDVGRDDNTCFIVSEFVEGGSLADHITRNRPALQEGVRLVAEVAETLAYAHRQGFIHRDIKLGNILIDKLDLECAEAYHRRAGCCFNAGKVKESLSDFDVAARLEPKNAEVFKNRGLAYLRLLRVDEAMADLRHAQELDPDHPEMYRKETSLALAQRGYVKAQVKETEEAIADMDGALRLDPTSAEVFDKRGSLHFNLKHFKEAVADFTEAIRLDPNQPVYYFHRGFAHEALGKKDEAAEDYKKGKKQPAPE